MYVRNLESFGNKYECILWPLARVIELVPGKDGQIRLVRVVNSRGQLLKPVQLLFPLQSHHSSECEKSEGLLQQLPDLQPSKPEEQKQSDCVVVSQRRVPVKITRSGRLSKLRIRFIPLKKCDS